MPSIRRGPILQKSRGAREALAELSARFLLGQEPFVPGDSAKRYTDFDQLMRRDEWFGRGDPEPAATDGGAA